MKIMKSPTLIPSKLHDEAFLMVVNEGTPTFLINYQLILEDTHVERVRSLIDYQNHIQFFQISRIRIAPIRKSVLERTFDELLK